MNDKLKPGANVQEPLERRADKQGRPADSTVFRKPAAGPAGNPAQAAPKDAAQASRVKATAGDTRVPPHGAVRAAQDATRMRPNPAATAGQQPDMHTRVRPNVRAQDNRQPGSPPPVPEHKNILKGRFILDKVIGVGGMGVVYKATDKLKVEAHDREPFVAIKVLSEEFKTHPESFIALQRESRKTQRISHPNVVKVYDFDRDGDVVFMTMEYMEGRPLDQIIKQYSNTGLPRDDAWTILNGLCSALVYAHAEKIVHSDFKPGNIFITDAGYPKIFDFGIARAVANVDRLSGKSMDRTVFDAGSLGALTPAYASLEMLLGRDPDVRDDIYALGCIAYEMLTGMHPYNRIPADEAFKSRLKPAKIPGIKSRQWKAIEKALSFKREDRLASVEEFQQLIQPKTRSFSLLMATLLVVAAIGTAAYFIVANTPAQREDNALQLDEIEFKIRYDLFAEKLGKLVADPRFTPDWENVVWDEFRGIYGLLGNQYDEWLTSTRRRIYQLYASQYSDLLRARNFARASAILENAYRYTDDTATLDREKQNLAELIRQEAEQANALKSQQQQARAVRDTQVREKENRDDLFDLAMKNVNQQLQCQARLDMRDFGIAVEKLRATDLARYAKVENTIIVKLSECITQVGRTQPERALEAKNYALRIFDNHRYIAAINITPRDACDKSIAGLGSRGDRAVCRDKLSGGATGPALVVVPGKSAIPVFAIGKYELSIKEFNQYCKAESACRPIPTDDDGMPVVNVDINLVNGYIKWLSRATQQKYRLPTRSEWLYAAEAVNQAHDPNRNCQLNSRGIEKGGKLVRANTGVQNSWGLVNYLGNAREWVYDKSRNLLVVGGSFEDSMDRCDTNTRTSHAGNADAMTGFRVLREIPQ